MPAVQTSEQWAYVRLSKESNPGLRDYDPKIGDVLCWVRVVVQNGETKVFADNLDVTNRATIIRYYSTHNTVGDGVAGYGSVGVTDMWL